MKRAAGLFALLLCGAGGLEARTLVVDTFDAGTASNKLGGPTNVWGDTTDKSVGCTMAFDKQVRVGDEGYSLRLDYNVESHRENEIVPPDESLSNPARRKDDVYNGYYSVMNLQDLRPFGYIVLWARSAHGAGFTRSFKLELKDPTGASGVMIDGLTDEWQRFAVPMVRFKELKDLSKVREWTVVFGPDVVTRKAGTVYIDDVYFATDPDEKIRNPARTAAVPKRSPEVDGNLGEWDPAAFTDFSDPAIYRESGKVQGPADLKASFSTAWDEKFLYVAVDVRDNAVMNAQAGADIWKDDCVEIYLDPPRDGFLWGSPRDFQLGFAPLSASGEAAAYAWFQRKVPAPEEVRWKIMARKDGYQLEAAIAWSFLGFGPQRGEGVGFSVAVHDRDRKKEGKVIWSYFGYEGKGAALGTLMLR